THPFGSVGIALVDWCASLMNAQPRSVWAQRGDAAEFASLLLEGANGQAIAIRSHRTHHEQGSLRLAIEAERGSAAVQLPGWVSWTSPEGQHSLTLSRSPSLGRVLLERFHRVVRERQPPEPSLGDAYRVLGWLRAMATSQT